MISKLIFAGYTGSKNQVRTRQKIEFVSNSIFFRVCSKLPNWHFTNQAQIDTAIISDVYRADVYCTDLIRIYLWNVELKFWCPFWILCFNSSCPATIFRQNLFIILNLQKNIHRVTVICAALAVASQSILDLLKPEGDRLSKEN